MRELGDEAVGGGPGQCGDDRTEREHAVEGGVEELGEERDEGEERGARGGVRRERLEAVSDVGQEGIEREELVVLRQIEGRDGCGGS